MQNRDLYGKTSKRRGRGQLVSGYDIVGLTDIVGAAALVPAAVATGQPVQSFGGLAMPQFGLAAPPGYMNQGGVMVPIGAPPPQVGIPVGAPNNVTRVINNDTHKVLRRQVLGFGSQSVGAGATVTFSAQPQRTMRLEKLVATASAAGLLVTGINIGADPQFVNVGAGVPIEMFSANALDNSLRSVTANLGHVVSIQVQNPTVGAITCSLGAIGEAMD